MNDDQRGLQRITDDIFAIKLHSVEKDCHKMFGQSQREDEKNKLLPYADRLEMEAAEELRRIKTYLGSAILLREVREPLLFWLQRLDIYIELYGMKFSKQDHILFVHIVYDLMTIPDAPLSQLMDVYHTLRKLLSKKKLLIPGEDLTLPWRPLYDICKKVYFSSNLKQMMLGINSNVKMVFEEILADVRYYFPPSSTQEILDELRPMLCPFEAKAVKLGVQMLSLFLPLSNSPKLADSTYKLWLDEMLRLWDACSNFSFAWEDDVMYLMAWLAFMNAGCIDWEEHMPMMYTKFLKIFKLPICYKKTAPTKMTMILEDRAASWIVSTLGGGSKSQDYLDQLLITLDSYCHSANSGFWVSTIKLFFKKLCWFFKARVKRERFKDVFWGVKTPEDKKLTDDDITRFVISMRNVSMHAMFSPTAFVDFTKVFFVLASFRPDLIVPALLDRLYATIDCVTEPHKFIASLKCVRSVARPMLSGGLLSSYADGKKHVIPLLFAVLPGIDPNDHQKLIVTMQFISTFLNMIPVIDCSSYCSKFKDITADEEEIANATSQFEEFIIAYMDRIFSFIESAAQENVRIENHSSDERSRVERHVLTLMGVACTAVFGQLSYPIFMTALKKLYNYSLVKIFEREVAGYAIATLIRGFAKVNGEETYKLFIPPLASYVLEAAKNQGIKNEEHLDNELLYKMLLLSESVAGEPQPLAPYVPQLTKVLEETLHLKCREGYQLSFQLLSNVMSTLSTTCPTNSYVYAKATSVLNFTTLPIRDWGKMIGWKNLKIDWYVPRKEEISLVENLLWKFLLPEIERIDKYSNDELDLSRDEIRSLLSVLVGLFSCGSLLAPLEDESGVDTGSKVPMPTLKLNFGIERHILMPDGSNVYKVLIEKLARFQTKFVAKSDDTIAMVILSKIWAHLLLYDVLQEGDYKERKHTLKLWKNLYVDGLGPYYTNLRSVLIEEVALKNAARYELDGVTITKTHRIAFLKLFELATSDYRPVQFVASNIFQSCIMPFADNSYIVDQVIENLRVDNVKHKEKFKSTLALLKERPRRRKWYQLFTQSYDVMKRILPAIVTSMPSEEPTVIKLMDELSEATISMQWHLALRLRVPRELAERTKALWTRSGGGGGGDNLLRDMPSEVEMNVAESRLERENEKYAKDYEELLLSLLTAIRTKNLQWRYEVMAAGFIATLLLPDEPCPVEVVQYYLRILVDDLLVLRKMAIKSVICIMKLDKAKTIRERVDPFAISRAPAGKVKPGPRADNAWCLYETTNIPKNENEWNEVRYSYSCHLGYYAWPKEVLLHSSPTKQPINDTPVERMSAVGKEVDRFFSNKANVDKFMELLCLEEHKGEPLHGYNIVIFKYLFKIYGDRHFDTFRSYLENYLQKPEDNYQRCAAEMLAGIIQGTKLWPHDKCQRVTTWCVPLLRKTLDTMTVETQKHWGSAVATALLHCDVNKSSYLIELLLEDPIRGDASFKDCGRLYALQSGVLHTWRLPKFWNQLLNYIKPHLANRYQNIRERLGSVLLSIFETDIDTYEWNRTLSPHVSDFVDYLLPKLEILYKIAPNSKEVRNGDTGTMDCDDAEIDIPNEEEVEEAILLLKTVCKWCTNSAQRSVYPLKPDVFKLFPLFCYMENYDKDEELKKLCKSTLSVMSCCVVLQRDVPVFIEAFEKVSASDSWSARCTVLDFLQIFAFHNLFLVSSKLEWVDKIMTIVLRLLEDVRCEVRQKAGEVIGGFVHHGIVENTQPLSERFKKMSRTSLKNKSNINIRHAGVIGLCSFINAFPYTVPPEIPALFSEIGLHLNDPEPIPSTIRKTVGNFKRTHHVNWEESKRQFTADQLEIFTDIIIPPNHYA